MSNAELKQSVDLTGYLAEMRKAFSGGAPVDAIFESQLQALNEALEVSDLKHDTESVARIFSGRAGERAAGTGLGKART